MAAVTIRRAEPGDIAAVQALLHGLFTDPTSSDDHYLNLDWPKGVLGQTFLVATLADPKSIILVADRGNEIVGYLIGQILPKTDWRPVLETDLMSFYVKPEQRSHQIGRRLTEEFFGWSRTQNAHIVKVTVYAGNTDGRRFYQKMGFTPESMNMEVEL